MAVFLHLFKTSLATDISEYMLEIIYYGFYIKNDFPQGSIFSDPVCCSITTNLQLPVSCFFICWWFCLCMWLTQGMSKAEDCNLGGGGGMLKRFYNLK